MLKIWLRPTSRYFYLSVSMSFTLPILLQLLVATWCFAVSVRSFIRSAKRQFFPSLFPFPSPLSSFFHLYIANNHSYAYYLQIADQKINLERGELRQKNKEASKRKEELNEMLGAKQMEIAKIRGETEKIISDFNARLLIIQTTSWMIVRPSRPIKRRTMLPYRWLKLVQLLPLETYII